LRYLILSAVVVLGACAKQPDAIPAADIGPNPYTGHSCKMLAQERVKVSNALANLSATQKGAATGDTIGVLLLGLPISSMTGADSETGIAVAKGRLQAVDAVRAQKSCG
jgi:hypothetical protein